MKKAEGTIMERLGDPFYEGSVQRLYAYPDDPTRMVAETTAGGSVFDVGTIFEIPGSDTCRALFRHVLFTRLGDPDTWRRVRSAVEHDLDIDAASKELLLAGDLLDRLEADGATTHHIGMLDGATGELEESGIPAEPTAFNVVRRFEIKHPDSVEIYGAHLYDYSKFAPADGYVIPLEAIVRFGVTGASSVYKRSLAMGDKEKAGLLADLGVSSIEPWKMLTRPVLDFTSKYEPTDRAVTRQEALNMSGLTADRFAEMTQLAILGGYVVKLMFGDIGLQLWDLKWEFAIQGGNLYFVDTVDTDSVRATMPLSHESDDLALHVNKQAIRDYYEICHKDWIEGVKIAKAAADSSGQDFHELYREGQADGTYPPTPVIDPKFVAIQEEKLGFISAFLRGADAPSAIEDQLVWVCGKEISYYDHKESGEIEDFVAKNSVG